MPTTKLTILNPNTHPPSSSPDFCLMQVSSLLKEKRVQMGLLLPYVANHVGLSERTMQRYESGIAIFAFPAW